MSCPLKKSWKLRWRRALPAACQFNLRLVAACVLAVGPSGMEVFASATVSFVWMTLRPPKHHYIATASPLLQSPSEPPYFSTASRILQATHKPFLSSKCKQMIGLDALQPVTNFQLHFLVTLRYIDRCAFVPPIRAPEVIPMNTSPVRVERRVGQRFPYLLPVSLRQPSTGIESVGFTQDLSSRGVFFFTDACLVEGAEIELTVRMPSEITLGESMPVRCRGRILRVVRPSTPLSELSSDRAQTKIGVAVRLEGYEYLSSDPLANAKVSGLPSHHEDDRPLAHSLARP
jgi:hypothetical protein